jgi:hypothetical protein
MNVSVNVPEELYSRAAEVATAENVSVDDLFASAFEERLLEFERLKEKLPWKLSEIPSCDVEGSRRGATRQ